MVFPVDHTIQNSRTAIVLNIKFRETHRVDYSRAHAQILLGGSPIPFTATRFIEMEEGCLYSNHAGCVTGPSKQASARSEFELFFEAEQMFDSRISWINLLNIFHAGALPRIGYTVEYYQNKQLSYESFDCDLPQTLADALRADPRFDLRENLRPAISPTNISCKRVEAKG